MDQKEMESEIKRMISSQIETLRQIESLKNEARTKIILR